jgi:hypothetical protein
VLMRDQAADTVVLTLPAIVIAVISEEAMYAPLPDGWERARGLPAHSGKAAALGGAAPVPSKRVCRTPGHGCLND